MLKKILITVLVLVVLVVALGVSKTLSTPDHLYSQTGSFAGCPSRPSCVSSVAEDAEHQIRPLSYQGQVSVVVTQLRGLLEKMPGATAVSRQGNYIHAVFQTPTMKYRDDLELLVHADGRVDVRSISRFGYRDFGVNRDRIEALRQAFKNR